MVVSFEWMNAVSVTISLRSSAKLTRKGPKRWLSGYAPYVAPRGSCLKASPAIRKLIALFGV